MYILLHNHFCKKRIERERLLNVYTQNIFRRMHWKLAIVFASVKGHMAYVGNKYYGGLNCIPFSQMHLEH